jgi:hypothetical protein
MNRTDWRAKAALLPEFSLEAMEIRTVVGVPSVCSLNPWRSACSGQQLNQHSHEFDPSASVLNSAGDVISSISRLSEYLISRCLIPAG